MVGRFVSGDTVLLALSRSCYDGRTAARKPRLPLVVRVLSALSRVNALSGALAAGFGRALLGSVLRVL